jgi:hypothetical protein
MFGKSTVRFASLIFKTLFDLHNLLGRMPDLNLFFDYFGLDKREDFGVPLSESINFDYLRRH